MLIQCTPGASDSEAPPKGAEPSDDLLLERFQSTRDQAAFAALVRKHGALVRSVCWRVLQNSHDADDAFQATFLVLVRKAQSIGRRDCVSHWLYRVAYRIAVRARANAARRYTQEMLVARLPICEDDPTREWHDIEPVLDEELSRLPEKYRIPFVLCYLEGKTYDEVAEQLACPKGTISTRLTQARQLLRGRLVRRGVTLTTGALAAGFPYPTAAAGLPNQLIEATTTASLRYMAGETVAGVVSVQAITLTEGVLHAMWMTQLKIGVLVCLTAALLGGGAAAFAYRAAHAELQATEPGAAPQAAVAATTPEKEEPAKKTDRELLEGTWIAVSEERGGEKVALPADEKKIPRIIVKGDKLTLIIEGDKNDEMTIKLDETKTPKELDAMEKKGDQLLVRLAIYELKGDTFRVCSAAQNAERPTTMSTQAGSDWPALFVFKRQKAD